MTQPTEQTSRQSQIPTRRSNGAEGPSALRFCVRCLARWISTGVIMVLTLAAVLQGLVLLLSVLRVELPAPRLVLDLVQRQTQQDGVRVEWEAISVDLTARIHTRNLRLFDSRSGELLLSAEAALVALDLPSLMARKLEVESLRVDDATFYAPSLVASGGVSMPLVSEAQLFISVNEDHYEILLAQGIISGVTVQASGWLNRFDRAAERERPPLFDQLIYAATTFLELRQWSEAFEGALLLVQGEGDSIRFRALSRSVHSPLGRAEMPVLVTRANLAGGEPELQRISIDAQSAQFQTGEAIGRTSLVVEASERLGLAELDSSIPMGTARVWISGSTVRSQTFRGLSGLIQLQDGKLKGDVVGRLDEELVEAQFDMAGETIGVTLDGAFNLPTVLRMSGAPDEAILRWIRTHQPVRLRARLETDSRFVSPTLTFAGESRDLDARGLLADFAGFRGYANRRKVVLEQVDAVRGASKARGSFHQDLETLRWRLLIDGQAYPPQLGSLLGNWWRSIWKDFSFDGPPVLADVDVSGDWRSPDYADFYGAAKVWNGSYNRVGIDTASLRFHGGRGYFELYDLLASRGGETLGGEMAWLYTAPDGSLEHVGFDLMGNMALADLNQAFAVNLDDLIAEWTLQAPPRLALKGNVSAAEGGGWNTEVAAHAVAGAGAWRTITFDDIELKLTYANQATVVDIPHIRPLGGSGRGHVTITPQGDNRLGLAVEFEVEDADLKQSVTALRGLGGDPAGGASDAAANEQMQGRVNFTIYGTAAPEDFVSSLNATGNVSVYNAKLGQIELFGALSQQLSALGIRFSSFPLENLTGAYLVRDGKAIFDDLKIFGPTVNIEADGQLGLAHDFLDFNVRVFLMEGTTPSLMDVFGLILRPFGYALELQLKGSLDAPKWRFTMDPRNLFKQQEQAPQEGLPPPDGAPAQSTARGAATPKKN